ncbi:MAG: universal stress protein [Gammaproteobacteria bacterium]|jgi:nucleotide-binding universal stress UspA family protein
MFKKMLCPIDGSENAEKALEVAIDIAKMYAAELVVMHVPHRAENFEALERFAEVEGLAGKVNAELDRLRALDYRVGVMSQAALEDFGVSPRLLIEVGQHLVDEARIHAEKSGVKKVDVHLEDGNPADCILRIIDEESIDCVVVGSRGLGPIEGLFLGSVSHKVLNHAPCTCIVVK